MFTVLTDRSYTFEQVKYVLTNVNSDISFINRKQYERLKGSYMLTNYTPVDIGDESTITIFIDEVNPISGHLFNHFNDIINVVTKMEWYVLRRPLEQSIGNKFENRKIDYLESYDYEHARLHVRFRKNTLMYASMGNNVIVMKKEHGKIQIYCMPGTENKFKKLRWFIVKTEIPIIEKRVQDK